MRNDIFKQIEKNRSGYYMQLKHLNLENNVPLRKSENDFKNENHEETRKVLSSFILLSNILIKKLSGVKFPLIIFLKFAKKSNEKFKKKTSGISRFAEKINQSLIKKTDAIIERFYELGCRVFEDNTESSPSSSSKLEGVPVVSSQNDGTSAMYFQLFSTNTYPLFDVSGIIESFKTIQKNILIYLESDTFTFSHLERKDVAESIERKEINYEQETENDLQKRGSVLYLSNLNKTIKTKILTPAHRLTQKVIRNWKLNFLPIRQQFSIVHLQRLFPVLNRFI